MRRDREVEIVTSSFDWKNPPLSHSFSASYLLCNITDEEERERVFWLAGYEPKHNYISPGGGSTDPGENAVETAIRELYEETCSQVKFTKEEFEKVCFGVLHKTYKGEKYDGYVFLLLIDVNNEYPQNLDRDVRKAYRHETRDTFREVDHIVPVDWNELMYQEDIRTVYDAYTGKPYPLRIKAIDEMRLFQRMYH